MESTFYNRQPDGAKLDTAKERVLKLLNDRQPHTTMEILNVGGAEGTRRLRELRQEGYEIEGEKILGSNEWKYRLSGFGS